MPQEKKIIACDLCDNQGELYLHAVCHLTAPLQASLVGTTLTLRCYVPTCARIVAVFKVHAIKI